MGDACEKAAQARLQPFVVLSSDKVEHKPIDGTDWDIRTRMNHKTKLQDNWYDVVCVVNWTAPEIKVKSVETTAP
ncbi:hypothetical protein ACFVWG_17050 [Kribbella sp. NPDC058245]|uniref:hypothetical protein n=1 Tax=Kribbella sp. NPDC058245 TaxID=3346399 RepID=UPI0036EDCC1A